MIRAEKYHNPDADNYQQATAALALYKAGDDGKATTFGVHPIVYLTLGVAGEAGEVADQLKKILRAGHMPEAMPADAHRLLALELGDTLWYVARLADELGFDLSEIMAMNLEKLRARREKGTLAARAGGDA
ncbi:MAG TPA: nucleoside triphosphate pyrophosphohydrolase family protein [Terriglobales bacterium]|nr:nucleoside triphosphate pyrophosphohydrolase family protein [Terriglobales bacterium]